MDLYETVTRCMINGAPSGQLVEILREEIIKRDDEFETSEDGYQAYLLKLEEFLDDADIYAFEGWEDAEIVGHPRVSRFWVVVDMKLPPKTDLSGGLRIIGKDNENQVLFKKDGDFWMIRLKILKRTLDEIQQRNQREAKRRALEKVPPAKPAPGAPLGGGMGGMGMDAGMGAPPPGGAPPMGAPPPAPAGAI